MQLKKWVRLHKTNFNQLLGGTVEQKDFFGMWKETVGCITSNVIKSTAHDQINLEMKFVSVCQM